jgi:hypothetical protein
MNAIDAASRYLDALVSRDPANVPLAADVRRITNGGGAVDGADELRHVIRNEPPLKMGPLRWIASGDEAAVFYELEADMGAAGPAVASIGERFVVRDGSIVEIEVVYAAAAGWAKVWPAAEATGPPSGIVDAAQAYVAALTSHHAGGVPLAAGVRRVENGQVTGDGADSLRGSLESETMQSVEGISGERWLVAGDAAVVFYDLLARVGSHEMMVRVAERFRGERSRITEIEAVFATA